MEEEKLAYCYKLSGMRKFSQWKSGVPRSEMLADLKRKRPWIVHVCRYVGAGNGTHGHANEMELWQWMKRTGWRKSTFRNWFADSCDPTVPLEGDPEAPF